MIVLFLATLQFVDSMTKALNSIVRLITKLEDQIQHLTALNTSDPQRLIEALSIEIKRLSNTLEHKSAELIQVHQLNHQLQSRIRELEQFITSDATSAPINNDEIIKRDSHNSSQPPSLDPPWDKPPRTRSLRKRSALKPGGQPGHPGVTLLQVSNPDHIITHSCDTCSECQSSLFAIDPIRLHKRQVFDISDGRLYVIEHSALIKLCPNCKTPSRGQFPPTVKAPVQYAPQALSKSLYLHLYQLLPIARTAEAMRDLFACPISPATIQRAANLCSKKLIGVEQKIKTAITKHPVVGVDETGVRISGTTAWVHVARTDTLTHFAPHTRRGKPLSMLSALLIITKVL